MGESDIRKKYLEADGYYNENESYILREPSDEYKEEFFECCKESDIMKERLNEESYRDLSWKTLFIVGLLLFVIDKRTKRLCGYVELRFLDSDMPEIGIQLYSKYQRKGIGQQVIMLLLKRAQMIHPVESYRIKIYADNFPSQKLFEKMGAVKVATEDSLSVKVFKDTMKTLTGEALERYKQIYESVYKGEYPQVYVYELHRDKIEGERVDSH